MTTKNIIEILYKKLGSQRKVAEQLGVNQSTVSRILKGKIKNTRNPKILGFIKSKVYYRYRIDFYVPSEDEIFTFVTPPRDNIKDATRRKDEVVDEKFAKEYKEMYIDKESLDIIIDK